MMKCNFLKLIIIHHLVEDKCYKSATFLLMGSFLSVFLSVYFPLQENQLSQLVFDTLSVALQCHLRNPFQVLLG